MAHFTLEANRSIEAIVFGVDVAQDPHGRAKHCPGGPSVAAVVLASDPDALERRVQSLERSSDSRGGCAIVAARNVSVFHD
jgi:hypothetical protein